MLIELDEFDTRMFKKANEIIGKVKTINIDGKTYVNYEELTNIIDYLVSEYENIETKFKDYVRNVDDNFKQVSQAEQFDISDKDFI